MQLAARLAIIVVLAALAFSAEATLRLRDTIHPEVAGIELIKFNQRLDHFDALNNKTFIQRTWVNESNIDDPKAVFLIIGGESVANPKYLSVGAVSEMANENKAALFLIEHRYYGHSSPFTELTSANLTYLSSRQALADVAHYLEWVYNHYNISKRVPTVVFGCSYSGNLAAWFREKYPHLAYAALAGSAPVKAKLDFFEYDEFIRDGLGPKCAAAVRESNLAVEAALDKDGDAVKALFNCTTIKDNTAMLYLLADTVSDIIQYSSKYPERNETLCALMQKEDPIARYVEFLNWRLSINGASCAEWDPLDYTDTKYDPTSGSRQWMWQSCTEFGYLQSASPVNPLRSSRLTAEWLARVQCTDVFGILPDIDGVNQFYGSLAYSTNRVVFSNGASDPWSSLSITTLSNRSKEIFKGYNEVDSDLKIVVMKGATHCANWYPVETNTTRHVKEGREEVAQAIRSWLRVENSRPVYSVAVFAFTVITASIVAIVCGVALGYSIGHRENPNPYEKLNG